MQYRGSVCVQGRTCLFPGQAQANARGILDWNISLQFSYARPPIRILPNSAFQRLDIIRTIAESTSLDYNVRYFAHIMERF